MSAAAPWESKGGALTAGFDSGHATTWPTDAAQNALDVWARWESVSIGGSPPVPAIPLPPSKPGRPTVLALDPPAGSGFTSTSLRRLASDAAQRAWELAHGVRSSGLQLSMGEDLARRAAAMLSPGGEQGEIVELASLAGVPARDLLNQALAWRDGGSEGLFVLLEGWDAPRDSMVRAADAARWEASVPAQQGDARGATTPSRPGRSLVPVPPVGARRRLGRVDA